MQHLICMSSKTKLTRVSARLLSSSRARPWWEHVRPASADPIAAATEAFLEDTNPDKINLGLVSLFRDENENPVTLQCVRDAQAKIAGSELLGSISATAGEKFVQESLNLVYGNRSDVRARLAGVQALSGTGACRLFAELQRRSYPCSQIFLPDPTWPNHESIWSDAGIPPRTYRYYDPDTKGLNFGGMIDDIKNAPRSSFFLLHPCAHNPTGVDPTEEQWREISYQFKVKNHFAFFDLAYQGFASGDLNNDAKAIRIFVEDSHYIGCAQSFAKNMGLFGHRVGCLSIVCSDEAKAKSVKRRISQIARAMYGSPPLHGALLVSTILSNSDFKSLWIREVKAITDRIKQIRSVLRDNLEKSGSPLDWSHITSQVGMFCFSGLTSRQIDRLAREFHVHAPRDGRISMAGVTSGNVAYLAKTIHRVTTS